MDKNYQLSLYKNPCKSRLKSKIKHPFYTSCAKYVFPTGNYHQSFVAPLIRTVLTLVRSIKIVKNELMEECRTTRKTSRSRVSGCKRSTIIIPILPSTFRRSRSPVSWYFSHVRKIIFGFSQDSQDRFMTLQNLPNVDYLYPAL